MLETNYMVDFPEELKHLENEGLILSPVDQRYGLIGMTEQLDDSYLLRIFAISRESEEYPFNVETEVASFIAKDRNLMSMMFRRVTNMSALQYLLMVNQQQLFEFGKELEQH